MFRRSVVWLCHCESVLCLLVTTVEPCKKRLNWSKSRLRCRPRKPRIRSLSRSSHGKGVSSPLEIIVIFCCTADGSPLLFPSAVFPIGVSEQFLNGTSAHNRPFQCHIPIGRSHVKFSPSRNLPHAMRPVPKLLRAILFDSSRCGVDDRLAVRSSIKLVDGRAYWPHLRRRKNDAGRTCR